MGLCPALSRNQEVDAESHYQQLEMLPVALMRFPPGPPATPCHRTLCYYGRAREGFCGLADFGEGGSLLVLFS